METRPELGTTKHFIVIAFKPGYKILKIDVIFKVHTINGRFCMFSASSGGRLCTRSWKQGVLEA